MVGKYAWVPFFFGGSGYIFGGWLSGRLMRAGWSLARARKTAMLVGACFLPSAMLAPRVPTAGLAIVAVCFVVFGHAIWVANLLTLPADLFNPNEVGYGVGIFRHGRSHQRDRRVALHRLRGDAFLLSADFSTGRPDAPVGDGAGFLAAARSGFSPGTGRSG